jgi:hypothetical protein
MKQNKFIIIILIIVSISGIFTYATLSSKESTIIIPEGKTAIYVLLDTADIQTLNTAFCTNYHYQTTISVLDRKTHIINYVTNPQTCESFTQEKIKAYIKDNINIYEKNEYMKQYTTTKIEIIG